MSKNMYRFERPGDYQRYDLFARQRRINNALICVDIDIQNLMIEKVRCLRQNDTNRLSWIAHDLGNLKERKARILHLKEDVDKQLKNGSLAK